MTDVNEVKVGDIYRHYKRGYRLEIMAKFTAAQHYRAGQLIERGPRTVVHVRRDFSPGDEVISAFGVRSKKLYYINEAYLNKPHTRHGKPVTKYTKENGQDKVGRKHRFTVERSWDVGGPREGAGLSLSDWENRQDGISDDREYAY